MGGRVMTNQEAISVLESINAKTDYFLINDDARAEAIDMATSALQAQDVPDTNVGSMVSRQTACEYCHEDSDGYVRPVEKNSHAWLVRRGKTMKLRVCFKGEYRECDILFCPMCGRSLTHE
jgi:uncharacterized C2H2 Zn-finger protein